jgi:hypothetical protein
MLQNFKGKTRLVSKQCPYESGRYEISNWTISDSFLPKYLTSNYQEYIALATFFTIKGMKGEILRLYLLGGNKQ